MIFVPAGEFEMGDNFNEGSPDELPVHKVILSAYYIGKNEVTNTEYAVFLNAVKKHSDGRRIWIDISDSDCRIDLINGNYAPETGYANHPVIEVSWYGAVEYCNWLSVSSGLERCYNPNYEIDITKKGYRLPTEAEWEMAARGDAEVNASLGHQRRFPWGENIDGSYVNYIDSGDPYDNGTTPVRYYDGSNHNGYQTDDSRSPCGVFDMSGNVWEWCHDWYRSDYNSNTLSTNPIGASRGTKRVFRGGSSYSVSHSQRSANRSRWFPHVTAYYLGFRLARTY